MMASQSVGDCMNTRARNTPFEICDEVEHQAANQAATPVHEKAHSGEENPGRGSPAGAETE